MKEYFLSKLRRKLIIFIFIPISVIFLSIVFYLSKTIYNGAFQSSKELAINKASEGANKVKAYFENTLAVAQTVANAYQEWKENGNSQRKMIDLMMKRVLAENKNFLSVWSQFEYDSIKAKRIQTFTIENSVDIFGPAWLISGNEIVPDSVGEDYEDSYAEDYYILPKKTKLSVILEPYKWIYPGDVTKKEYYETSCVHPLIANDEFFGVVGIDVEFGRLHAITRDMNLSEAGTSGILSNQLTITMHVDTSFIGKNASVLFDLDSASLVQQLKENSVIQFVTKNIKNDLSYITTIARIDIGDTKAPWYYFVQIPEDEIEATANDKYKSSIFIGFFMLVLILIIIILISRGITIPIVKSVGLAKNMSDGILYQKLEIKNKDETSILGNSLNNMSSKIAETIDRIKSISLNYQVASQEIMKSADLTSTSASEQAASIEEISSSMEQMVSSVNQNAENAGITERIAMQAYQDIKELGDVMFATINSLKTIVEKISIINEIAERTNILAVNASIEAARAGEYGKGFAVVAGEVRTLSVESQNSAQIIRELSKETVLSAENSGKLISNTIKKIENTAQLVQEIAGSSAEQRHGLLQVNTAISQMNVATQSTAAISEEMSGKSIVLNELANELLKAVGFFKTEPMKESDIHQLQAHIMEMQKKLSDLLHNQLSITSEKNNTINNPEVVVKQEEKIDTSKNDFLNSMADDKSFEAFT